MGKTRDLFKKIRDTKGTFHAKMGLIKDRNGLDLTEEEESKTRWQKYTELSKKDLNDMDNHTMVWSLTQNWTWNNRQIPNWERSTSRLYIVPLII